MDSISGWRLHIGTHSIVQGLLEKFVFIQMLKKSSLLWCFKLNLGFDSWGGGLGIFLFSTVYRPVLGSTQAPIHWVPGALSLGVKRPGREADHSPPSNAEVKECVELYLHYPNTFSWRDVQLKIQGQLYFYLYWRKLAFFLRSVMSFVGEASLFWIYRWKYYKTALWSRKT